MNRIKRLWLFNPENDLALANGDTHFTPPKAALRLRRAGAMLPFWLGENDDYILVEEADAAAARRWAEGLPCDGPQVVSSPEGVKVHRFAPWGLSKYIVNEMVLRGMCEAATFGSANLLQLRDFSHRRISLPLLQAVKKSGVEVRFPVPKEIEVCDQVRGLTDRWGKIYVKAPWSSSGRGVFPADAETLPQVMPQIQGVIARQGSVMVEKALDKTLDFAMLFECTDYGVEYVALSVFFNATATHYGGNLVESQYALQQVITQYVTADDVARIRLAVADALAHILPEFYRGPVGVDMMIYRDATMQYRINPCVEVNLRYTMGFVAKGVYDKLSTPGIMRISPLNKGSERVSGIGLVPDNPYFSITLSAAPGTPRSQRGGCVETYPPDARP